MQLEPPTTSKPWVVRHAFGAVATVFGVAALLAGFWTQFQGGREITAPSELRVVLPLGSVAIVAAIVSLVRREQRRELAVMGIAMALAAPLLGWVVLVAAVCAAAGIALLIIAKFQ